MQLVGKINSEIYKCITEKFITDDVIITDERIAHIRARHPEDYKNSVITFWRVGDTTWKKVVNNKKVLYKKE